MSNNGKLAHVLVGLVLRILQRREDTSHGGEFFTRETPDDTSFTEQGFYGRIAGGYCTCVR